MLHSAQIYNIFLLRKTLETLGENPYSARTCQQYVAHSNTVCNMRPMKRNVRNDGTVTVSIRLDAETKAELRAAAKQSDATVSQLVRRAVKLALLERK